MFTTNSRRTHAAAWFALALGSCADASLEEELPELEAIGSIHEPDSEEVEAVEQALEGASSSVVVSVPQTMRSAPFNVERRLTVPPGFQIAVHARVARARFMTLTPENALLVSVPSEGKVKLVSTSGAVTDLLSGLLSPHDLVFHTLTGTTYLYVAEKNKVRRYLWQAGSVGSNQVVIANLPDASLPELQGSYGHELKNIALDGLNRLYVSIASATNADPADLAANPKRGAIYVYNADGSGGRLFAQGIRNAEGLAIEPGTNNLWVVVNNRDNLGYPFHNDWDGDGSDDYGRVMQSYVDGHPPEEFIRVRDGGNYGWPFCNPNPDSGVVNMPFDRDVQTNADGSRLNCGSIDRVNWGIHAHSAPLGLSFIAPGVSSLPAGYAGSAVSGYHGCWNCSQPYGYKVALFAFAGGLPTQELDLVNGFHGFGRPVDVVASAAGQLFISDDSAGAIYRLSYAPPTQSVSKLVLLDATTQQPIAGFDPLPNNAFIDLAALGNRPLSLRAYTSPTTVGSVRFSLDSSILSTESAAPYCINGDDGTRCNSYPLPLGSHTLLVTPYSASAAGGQAGTPLSRSFTVANAGTRVCASANENATANLSCPGGSVVRAVTFASYGTPNGSCGSFTTSGCNAASSRATVESACSGRTTCAVPATNGTFGDPCVGTVKRLSIQATCAP
jgi:glucose/arabinose dehydrogenase